MKLIYLEHQLSNQSHILNGSKITPNKKRTKQHPPKKDHFPLIEKEDLTDKINLSGPQTNDSKYTINQVFDLHDPLDTIPLSKLEIENIFLPPTENNYSFNTETISKS